MQVVPGLCQLGLQHLNKLFGRSGEVDHQLALELLLGEGPADEGLIQLGLALRQLRLERSLCATRKRGDVGGGVKRGR